MSNLARGKRCLYYYCVCCTLLVMYSEDSYSIQLIHNILFKARFDNNLCSSIVYPCTMCLYTHFLLWSLITQFIVQTSVQYRKLYKLGYHSLHFNSTEPLVECPSLNDRHQSTMLFELWKFYLIPTLIQAKLPSKDLCRHNAVPHLSLISTTWHTQMISNGICTASGSTRAPTQMCFAVRLIKITKYVLKKHCQVLQDPVSTTSDVCIVSIHQIKDSEGLQPLFLVCDQSTTTLYITAVHQSEFDLS